MGSCLDFCVNNFFGAEDGSGIYQFDMSTINSLNKTCSFKEAGKSATLAWNDGFSCQDAIGGIIPTLPPNPTHFTTPTTTTTTTTTKAPERPSDDEPKPTTASAKPTRPPQDDPPKIGQVRCMAKLSKFEG